MKRACLRVLIPAGASFRAFKRLALRNHFFCTKSLGSRGHERKREGTEVVKSRACESKKRGYILQTSYLVTLDLSRSRPPDIL